MVGTIEPILTWGLAHRIRARTEKGIVNLQ